MSTKAARQGEMLEEKYRKHVLAEVNVKLHKIREFHVSLLKY